MATPVEVPAAGGKVSLFVEVTPKPGIHVYAPGTENYIPISIKLDPAAGIKAGKLTYPKSEMMTFADEKVPDLHWPEWVAWLPLLLLIVVLGVYPNLVFGITDEAVGAATAAFGG